MKWAGFCRLDRRDAAERARLRFNRDWVPGGAVRLGEVMAHCT